MYNINVIKRSEFHLYAPLTTSMLSDRKAIFMDALKWEALRANHLGWERDEYDSLERDDVVYIILEDVESGRHLASGRIMPTTSAHMLKDHFHRFTNNEPYIAPKTWEISRLCVAPRRELKKIGISPREAETFVNMLANTVVNLGALAGINRYVGITDNLVFRYYQKNNYSVQEFGRTDEGYIITNWDIKKNLDKKADAKQQYGMNSEDCVSKLFNEHRSRYIEYCETKRPDFKLKDPEEFIKSFSRPEAHLI